MLNHVVGSFKRVNQSSANPWLQMLLGIATSTAKDISDSSLFSSKVVCVDLKFSSDLNLLAVEGWVFPVCKDRRVRDLS
jgi:hypothetical protein